MTSHPTRRTVLALAAVLGGAALTPTAQTPPAPHVIKVAGDKHKLALRSDGSVVGWMQFKHGQLGPVAGIVAPGHFSQGPVAIQLPGKAIDVAAGDFASYAVLDDGTAWAWGRGGDGQLGTGPNPPTPLLATSTPAFEYRGAERPLRVHITDAVSIDAAGNMALAVLRDGTVRAWGLRSSLMGEAGRRTPGNDGAAVFEPVRVEGAVNVARISISLTHALALTNDGRVLAWGWNKFGAVGREPMQEEAFDRPFEVAGLTDVIAVAAANHVSIALKRDGTVWVWGSNRDGQFGNGVNTSNDAIGNTSAPRAVQGISGVVAIAAGQTGRHVVALLKDGTLRAWGNTDWGQIGAGVAATFQPKPVTPKITGVKAVFAAGNNTFAVKTDGSFWGWGVGGSDWWPFKAPTKLPVPVDLSGSPTGLPAGNPK